VLYFFVLEGLCFCYAALELVWQVEVQFIGLAPQELDILLTTSRLFHIGEHTNMQIGGQLASGTGHGV
jgi:hypothetical protein